MNEEQIIKIIELLKNIYSNQAYKDTFVYSLIGVLVSVIIFDLNLTSQKDIIIIIIILIFLIFCVVFSFIFKALITSISKFARKRTEIKLKQEQENNLNKLKQEQENNLTEYLLNSNKLQKQCVLKFDTYLFSRREFLYIDYGSSCHDGKYALEDMVQNKVLQLINEEERM